MNARPPADLFRMSRFVSALPLLAALFTVQAQQNKQETSVFTYDLNGQRVNWTESRASGSSRSETFQNINGRRVAAHEVEERVLSSEEGRRVVERLVKNYDNSGNPLPAEKSIIETTKRSDGSIEERTMTYRGDINGRLQPAERSVRETRPEGEVASTTDTTVERLTLNGGFEVVERRQARQAGTKADSTLDETIYRRDANGHFAPAARQVVHQITSGESVQQQVDDYETASTGQMRVFRQSVSRAVKDASGAERREVDVFGAAAPGRPIPNDGRLQLREHQIYTTRQSEDGSLIQVFAIQRPNLTNGGTLGPVQKISETVCKGACR